MDKGDIYGALIAGDSGSASQLIVVSSISDLSALDITAHFEEAAKQKTGDLAAAHDHAAQVATDEARPPQGATGECPPGQVLRLAHPLTSSYLASASRRSSAWSTIRRG